MKRPLIVVGGIVAAGITLVVLVVFLRFNITNGGDDLDETETSHPKGVKI